MTEIPRLQISGLHKRFGAVAATAGVDLDVRPREVHALIGPNGAGKTTLISQIAGEILPDEGRILMDGRDITRMAAHARAGAGLARSFQITQLFPDFTALDNVAMAVQARQGRNWNLWGRARRDLSLRDPAMARLDDMGLADRADIRVSDLAHGECRQLELAVALAAGASLLLLDEPMAGLGHEESLQMTAILERLKGSYAILLVEHDMDAVFALADRVTVLVYGRTLFTGTPDEVRAHPEVRAAYLGDGA
ncbi:ABC transporter ATP-binding protein [Tistrella bauzanensis]|uniref:ABC transporter ATP-binding protein n=1 Tax=Tistrella bauzanensis TaxID=657419 RepID=A0ABQ1IYD8_9PROT|nr:ABC transporter ATP-binding protein [Tistrella bauzanensis]GGB55657.1 ABC transporter ATP-binding protein [Tistrella bauzanensis]